MNRAWYQLMLKKKSAGPGVERPPEQSLQLFFMASYDLDRFRRFVLSASFRATYPLTAGLYTEITGSDEALRRFSCRFLRQVLFAEHSNHEAAHAWENRVAQRNEIGDARGEIPRRAAADDARYSQEPTPRGRSCRGS